MVYKYFDNLKKKRIVQGVHQIHQLDKGTNQSLHNPMSQVGFLGLMVFVGLKFYFEL